MPWFIFLGIAALGMAAFYKPPVRKEKHPLPPLPPGPPPQVPPFIPEGPPPFIPEGEPPPIDIDFPTAPPFPLPEPIEGTGITWMSGDKTQISLEKPFVEDDPTDAFSWGRMVFEEAMHSFDPAVIDLAIEDLLGRLDNREALGWTEAEISMTAAMQSALRMMSQLTQNVPPGVRDMLPTFYEDARRAIDSNVQAVEDVIAEYQHDLWNPTQALRIVTRYFTPFIPKPPPSELTQMYQNPADFGL